MSKTEKIMEIVNGPHQFSAVNGIRVTAVEPGRAEGELVVGPDSVNPRGNVHGGALSTLADVVGGCCACSPAKTAWAFCPPRRLNPCAPVRTESQTLQAQAAA